MAAATAFLSRLSLPGSRRLLASEPLLLGGEYFPLVGLLLALCLWFLLFLCSPWLSSLPLAALLVVGLVLLTGGLHLDGLMDTCDGLFGGLTRERQLEIMHDSRVGSFGVLGGASSMLLKFACLASARPEALPAMLLVTLPVARWSLVFVMKLFPDVRTDGLGVMFRRSLTPLTLLIASALLLLIVLVSSGPAGLLVWGLVAATSFALGFWISRKLGGLTGDTCGAIAEVAEVVGLLAFLFLHV